MAVSKSVSSILASYDSSLPGDAAARLRDVWAKAGKGSAPARGLEQRELPDTETGESTLKEIGEAVAKGAGKKVDEYLPLARTLWDEFGSEGKAVAAALVGTLGLVEPQVVLPVLRELARTCATGQEADCLATEGVEPLLRQKPPNWIASLEPWLADENKWVRRVAVTVLGRLPMKQPELTRRALDLTERLLGDGEPEVRQAVSYAIRMSARGEVPAVVGFLARHVPPAEPSGNWVLCDVILSMSKQSLPSFTGMLTRYERWAKDAKLNPEDKALVDSAVQVLREAARKRGRA